VGAVEERVRRIWLVEVEAPNIQAEIAAGIDELRTRTGATSFITVGFCFGGSNSFLAATNGELGLVGAVGFYGRLDPAGFGMKIPSPVDLAPETKAPVLGSFGGGDPSIPQDRIDAYEAGLRRSGVEHEIHVYPATPSL
jgi:carboxymethylenebutenolidase